MFKKLKNAFKKKPEPVAEKPKQTKKKKSEKEIATEKNEPWVSILSVDLDPNDVGNGAFELDWNDVFVAKLVKAGYMMDKNDTDADIVDRWFQNICRHVVMETWEQEQAMNPTRQPTVKDIGDGLTEVS